MNKPALHLVLAFVALAVPAAAQDARFHTGNFSWTPVITLRDAGLDTNVYDESSDPKRDQVMVVAPQVEGVLQFGLARLAVSGSADFVYYRQYSAERSINRRASTRLEVPLSRMSPFVALGYVDSRERQNSEIDVRARHTDRDLTAGVGFQLTSRGELELGVRAADSRFRQGDVFRGVELATRFDRDARGAAARFRYDITPLTTFVVDADAARDEYVLSPGFDTNHLRVTAGFAFSPDAVLKGRATAGYHKMEPRGALAFGYQGVTAAVEIGYVLLGRTRIDGRFNRDTTQSLEAQPYFLQTTYGAEVLHNLFGPVDVIGRGSRELMDYPGIAERQLEADTLRLNRYGAAVAIRAAERVRLTMNYEYAQRLGVTVAGRDFERTRVYSTVTYGF
jgi:hypothetical protein